MNLPALPTDNLYKFMALAGLLIVGCSVALPRFELRQLEGENWQIEKDLTVLEIESKNLLLDTQNAQKNALHEYKGRVRELELKTGVIEVTQRRQKAILNEIKETTRWYASDVAFGIGLAWVGFLLWYRKLQRFQDLIVAKQAEQ